MSDKLGKDRMRGRLISRTWKHDPTLYVPPRYRRACRYEPFIPRPLADESFDLSIEAVSAVSEAERIVAELHSSAGPELAALARLLLRTESIASSKVEGMQADVRQLARAEARRRAGRSIGQQAAEIIANIDAMELAVEQAASAEHLSPEDLRSIHKALLARGPSWRDAGRVRDTQNWIGGNDYNPCGADYVPPPPEEVASLLDDLCDFCNTDDLPPLLQAAIAHAQFETIHPFDDGNGRTGRALVQVLLRRRGLAPSFVPPISVALWQPQRRETYIKGLVLFREDRVAEWIAIFAEATARAAQLAQRYRELVADLREFWRARLRVASNPRSDAAAWAIIDALPAHPVVTVTMAVESTGRTPPAVNNGMAQLERAGVLTPLGESRRNRSWEPEGLLDLITALEAGEA